MANRMTQGPESPSVTVFAAGAVKPVPGRGPKITKTSALRVERLTHKFKTPLRKTAKP